MDTVGCCLSVVTLWLFAGELWPNIGKLIKYKGPAGGRAFLLINLLVLFYQVDQN